LQTLPVVQYFYKRAGTQFGDGQSRKVNGLFFGQRAAVNCAQEVIQQSLASGGIVENVSHQSGFRRLLDEILQTLRSGVETLQEKCIDRSIAGRQLRRMQIPALIESSLERMLDVIIVELPGSMDHLAVFVDLFWGQWRAAFAEAMRRHRHDVSRAI